MVTKKATQLGGFFYLCIEKSKLFHKFMNQ